MLTAVGAEPHRPTLKVDSVPPNPTEGMTLVNPRDHSQLQAAWEAMLHGNFLVPRFTTVGQLYFGSVFTVKVYPRLEIPMPPSSSARLRDVDGIGSHDRPDTDKPVSLRITKNLCYNMSLADNQGSRPVWGAMHLARAVRTVAGCKENMWKAYQELLGEQLSSPPPTISSPIIRNVDPLADVRDAFEAAWSNWER
jgi:hypothetical protein